MFGLSVRHYSYMFCNAPQRTKMIYWPKSILKHFGTIASEKCSKEISLSTVINLRDSNDASLMERLHGHYNKFRCLHINIFTNSNSFILIFFLSSFAFNMRGCAITFISDRCCIIYIYIYDFTFLFPRIRQYFFSSISI